MDCVYAYAMCIYMEHVFKRITVSPQTCKTSTSLASRGVGEQGQRQTVCGGFVGESHHTTAAHCELCH